MLAILFAYGVYRLRPGVFTSVGAAVAFASTDVIALSLSLKGTFGVASAHHMVAFMPILGARVLCVLAV
ncbi:hypothetical protein BH11ARM2_BH11ARM2_17510 [soil metagenome]